MDKNEILNIGLSLAMEFGENWLKPIQSRLANQCPDLNSHELDEYNSTCQAVMKTSNNLVYSMMEKDGLNVNQKDWEKTILRSYPWINQGNRSRLFSQGMYYAMK
jgi:hypothetical protein